MRAHPAYESSTRSALLLGHPLCLILARSSPTHLESDWVACISPITPREIGLSWPVDRTATLHHSPKEFVLRDTPTESPEYISRKAGHIAAFVEVGVRHLRRLSHGGLNQTQRAQALAHPPVEHVRTGRHNER